MTSNLLQSKYYDKYIIRPSVFIIMTMSSFPSDIWGYKGQSPKKLASTEVDLENLY